MAFYCIIGIIQNNTNNGTWNMTLYKYLIMVILSSITLSPVSAMEPLNMGPEQRFIVREPGTSATFLCNCYINKQDLQIYPRSCGVEDDRIVLGHYITPVLMEQWTTTKKNPALSDRIESALNDPFNQAIFSRSVYSTYKTAKNLSLATKRNIIDSQCFYSYAPHVATSYTSISRLSIIGRMAMYLSKKYQLDIPNKDELNYTKWANETPLYAEERNHYADVKKWYQLSYTPETFVTPPTNKTSYGLEEFINAKTYLH
jgi:hypothetical protein